MGRADDNDLVLPDIGVSRRHARIVVDETTVRFEDLGSGNGSFHRGRRIESQTLADGDEIVIEPFVLQFRITAASPMARALEDDETLRAPPSDAMGAPARLVVLAGHRLASAYPLGGDPVAMGRSEAREIVLYDPAASRNHARVELRSEGYWLVDNESANGTYVNGRRVRQHPLSTGDVIRIGSTEFRFELLGPLPVPERPSEDPTIRAPESLPQAPAAPPPPVAAPQAPPPQAPPPQAPPPQQQPAAAVHQTGPHAPVHPTGPHAPVQPAPVQPAPVQPPAASPAERVMWARGAQDQAQPAPAPPPPKRTNTTMIAVGALAMFFALGVVGIAGVVGFTFLQQQQADEARTARIAQARAFLDAGRSQDDAALNAGKLLFHEGRYRDSVMSFYGVVQSNPADRDAIHMGYVAVEHMLLDSLVKDAEQKATSDRDKSTAAADAHKLAGRALSGKADLSEALSAVDAALRLNPDSTQLTEDRTKLRAARADATKDIDRSRLSAKVAKIHQIAEDALAEGNKAEAVSGFKKVQKADPERVTWYWYEAARGLIEAGAE